MRRCGFLQKRKTEFRTEEGAPRVDLVHQVEPLQVNIKRAGQLDSACVVDQNVDPTKPLNCLLDCIGNLMIHPNICGDRQGLTARLSDGFCSRVNRSRKTRMGFARFSDNCDIRSIFRGTQSNGQPDPATCSCDEQRLFVKRRNGFHGWEN